MSLFLDVDEAIETRQLFYATMGRMKFRYPATVAVLLEISISFLA
jgi:hypothetical protein